MNRCDCCGEEHEGNYCPLCGQKATHGPVTWASVWAGIMEIWGLHSRSLPYTAWQLLFRPGHLMRDYVIGKRQVSFPPVKMLVILGVIVYLIGHWLSPEDYSHELPKITTTGVLYYIDYAWKWVKVHDEWMSLVSFSIFIFPTWIVFRQAPLLKRHSLPQGFFIQVFIANQSLVITLIGLLLSLLLFFVPYNSVMRMMHLLLVMYLYIDYKQLFGYNWWGTLWRLIAMSLLIIMLLFDVVMIIAVFMSLYDGDPLYRMIVDVLAYGLVSAWLTYFLMHTVGVVNRKLWLERGKWAVIKWPLITLVIVIAFEAILYSWDEFGCRS